MKNFIFIQARLNSSRFPNKVFHKINNKYAIQWLLDEILKLYEIKTVLLVPWNDLDSFKEKLEKIYPDILILSGSEHNVLERFYRASEILKPDNVVRLTADCICLDSVLIKNTLNYYLKNNFDYVSNFTLVHSLSNKDARNYSSSTFLPDGFSVEVFSKNALEKAYNNVNNKNDELSLYDKEHVSTWMKRNLNCGLYKKDFLYVKGKFSLDYKEDFEQIKSYYNLFNKKYIKIKCLKDLQTTKINT